MASQAHLDQKQLIIDEIGAKFEKASAVVVLDYIGATVAQADSMRNKLRNAGVDYKVYKNTLIKRAIAGTDNEKLAGILDGPSALAFGYEDATAPARVLDEVIREFKKMSFKAGIVEGVYYDADGIKQVAAIPNRETLIARFLGSVQSPVGKLVRTFAAIAEEGGAGSAEAAPETPAPEVAAEAEPVAEAAAEAAPEAAETAEPVAEAAPEAAEATEPVAEAAEAEAAPDAAAEAEPVAEATEAEAVPEATEPVAEAAAEAAPEAAEAAEPAAEA